MLMRSCFLIGLLCLVSSACRHTPPRSETPVRLSTDAQIEQHIVGEWASLNSAFGYPKILIAADGSLFGIANNGAKELIGSWEYLHHALRVVPTEARKKSARAAGFNLGAWEWYPVDYADDHVMVIVPDTTLPVTWRFTR